VPGISIAVGDMVAALRRVAGDAVADRVKWQYDPVIDRIVSTWPSNFAPKLGPALGMKTDAEGRAIDFAGNEKCAAGAGSFAEAMSRALQMTLKEFGDASLQSDKSIPMNAQCTVFAESEVVSLIHSSTPKNDIAKAVLDAVASRVCAMVRRVGIEGEVVLIGGMVHNAGFVQSLKTAMGVDSVSLPDMPEYISALGCALIAAERQN